MITPNFSTQTCGAAGQQPPVPSSAANFVWIVILTLAGVGGSLVISCVTPLVALAVALAGTVRLALALRVMIAIWLTNQFIGFAFLHFPWTAFTLRFGAAIGIAALLSTFVAGTVLNRAASLPAFARLGLALLLGYLAYEISLFVAALFIGGLTMFSPAIMAQIALSNFVWLAGIVVLNELVAVLCKPWVGVTPRLVSAS
jgi:hypothetical protein